MPAHFSSVIVLVAACAAGLTMLLVLRLVTRGTAAGLRKRLARVRNETRPAAPDLPATMRRTVRSAQFARLNDLAGLLVPRPALLRRRLARTDRNLAISEYVLICLLTGAATAIALTKLVGLSMVLSILIAASVGLGLPYFWIGHLIGRRLKAFTDQFPGAIDLIVRGLKSGIPVPESIRIVGEELEDPTGAEFRIVSDRLKLGDTLDDALNDAAARLDTPEFHFFVISLAVQRETGGNLAETLENLADILRKRRQMHLKIKAMASEARASAMILGSLPFVMFAIMFAVNRGYVMTLFSDPRGHLMVGAALCSLVVGVVVMSKMAKFEV